MYFVVVCFQQNYLKLSIDIDIECNDRTQQSVVQFVEKKKIYLNFHLKRSFEIFYEKNIVQITSSWHIDVGERWEEKKKTNLSLTDKWCRNWFSIIQFCTCISNFVFLFFFCVDSIGKSGNFHRRYMPPATIKKGDIKCKQNDNFDINELVANSAQ